MTGTTLMNRVREYRLRAGLTQTQLGDLVGVSKNSISAIELYQCGPTAYTAALLCKCLDCTFDELFYIEIVEVDFCDS